MRILHAMMRAYAYAYHFLTALFLLGIAVVTYLGGKHTIDTGGMTDMTGEPLTRALLGIGLGGIVCVILAILGRFRWLFTIYAACAMVTMFRWFFLSSYRFENADAFQGAIWLFVGSVGAFLCSFPKMGSRTASVIRRR